MNLKAPLLETAQELFATLTRINPQLEVRKRYDILRSILNIAVEQQLTDVTIKLSGLYAKIDWYLIFKLWNWKNYKKHGRKTLKP